MVHRHEHLCSASQLWLPHPALCVVLPECFRGLRIWSRAMGSKSSKLQNVADCDKASDFQRSFGLNPGLSCMTARIFAPRSDKLSRTTKPPLVGIREFSDFKPALWSFTSCSLVEPFFGTVNMGCVTIPGSKFGLNASEYHLSEISASHWDFKKVNDSSSSTGNPCRHITDP